jgi:hypothetical protein
MDTVDAAQLCEYCSKINFDALRCPSVSEITNLQRGESTTETLFFKASKGEAAHNKTNLGFLSRIKQDAHHCRLCNLIWQTLMRYNPSQTSHLTSNSEDVTCLVDIEFYGIFWNPRDETKCHHIRRVSIITKIGDTNTNDDVHFAFQTCNKDVLSVQVDENFKDPRQNVDMLVFGGRKRPLEVNLQWLRRWIELCQHDHGKVCELQTGQDKFKCVHFDENQFSVCTISFC